MSIIHLIGVDLGTSVVKATLFDENGAVQASAERDVQLRQPAPGLAEQDPDEFYATTLSMIRQVVEQAGIQAGAVAAIAFDGQMGGAIAIDRQWNALSPWYPSTLDTRYLPYQNWMAERIGERLIEVTGDLPILTPRLLWWKNERPELFARIDKALVLANYIAGRMAGLNGDAAFIDPSYLTWIGLADTAQRAWQADLAAAAEIDLCQMPRIVAATTVVGQLTPAAAAASGLLAGTPLVAGAGDQVASFLGAGLVESGQLIDGAGTYAVLGLCLDRYVADTQHRIWKPLAAPLSVNHWYPLMYISGGGLSHRWFIDEFGGAGLDQAEQAANKTRYAEMDRLASAIAPGSQGLLCLPHLGGRACPNHPELRGGWLGFTWTHRRAHFYRALLESIAYDYAVALEALRSYAPDVVWREVRVIGGGAASQLWNQIKADVLGLPYMRLARKDAAAMGCAIMAGHAVGIYDDMAATALRWAQTSGRIEPDAERHQRYQPYVAAYHRALTETAGVYALLNQLRTG
jgi:xylulokinase